MIPHLIKRRRLEHGLGLSTALLIIALISMTLMLVQSSVDRSLNRGLEARALSISRSIGAVARPSLLAYNYAALQVAADGAVDDPDIHYVLIRDKEGRLAASAGSVGAGLEPLPDQILGQLTRELRQDDTRILEASVPVLVEGTVEPWGSVTVALRGDLVAAELRVGMHDGSLVDALRRVRPETRRVSHATPSPKGSRLQRRAVRRPWRLPSSCRSDGGT